MKVNALGYVIFESPDPASWVQFAQEFIGADASFNAGGGKDIRFDERHFRISVEQADAFRLATVGWEVGSRMAFEAGLEQLDSSGLEYEELAPKVCIERHIEEGVRFTDPLGNETEVFFGGHALVEPISLRHGIQSIQLGHVIFGTENQEEALERFYVGTLGLKVSDYLEFPYGSQILRATFLRAGDGRHHSIAFTDVGLGLDHLAITVGGLDDVGRGWDRAQRMGLPIIENLGRHSNSLEISFYVIGPDNLTIEYGTSPLVIQNDQFWRARRLNSGSLWGHHVNEELAASH